MWRLTAETLVYSPASEEVAVIYNTASGDTHLVSALAAQVISHLATAPKDGSRLLSQIADRYASPLDVAFPQALESTLADLHRLDLITDISV